jgi:hypothetical protein
MLQNVVWSVLVEMLICAMVEFDFDSVEASLDEETYNISMQCI